MDGFLFVPFSNDVFPEHLFFINMHIWQASLILFSRTLFNIKAKRVGVINGLSIAFLAYLMLITIIQLIVGKPFLDLLHQIEMINPILCFTLAILIVSNRRLKKYTMLYILALGGLMVGVSLVSLPAFGAFSYINPDVNPLLGAKVGTIWELMIVSFTVALYFKDKKLSLIRKEKDGHQLELTLKHTERKALMAQITDHSFLNVFNSIQGFIRNNKKTRADDYLRKIDSYTKSILVHTEKQLITLKEEVELVELYIDVEQLRLPDQFSYERNIDPEIPFDDVSIPPLIIQPFVDNAINHGLFHKKGKGTLKLFIEQRESGYIACTIEDNGIGRRAAQERYEGVPRRTSFGNDLTRKRIDLINQLYEHNFKISISDQDTGGGTKVEILIPFKNE